MKVSRRKSRFPRFWQRLTLKKIRRVIGPLMDNATTVKHPHGYTVFVHPSWMTSLDEVKDFECEGN